MSIKKAAQSLIKNWKVDQGILNMVEMPFRAYDPCLACTTHTLLGQMPLKVIIRDAKGNKVRRLSHHLHPEPLRIRVNIVPYAKKVERMKTLILGLGNPPDYFATERRLRIHPRVI